MNAPFISTERQLLSRRHFLRGAGVVLALPCLEAMSPVFAKSTRTGAGAASVPGGKPRRFLGVCNNLGLLPEEFFPKGSGAGYTPSPYLETLRDHRGDFTVFSGVSHPEVDGGHPADNCFLTAAPHPGSGGFRNTISLDQYVGERIGHLTRFPSLTLGVNVQQGLRSLSWTGSGVLIPCEEKAAEVFGRMFLQGSKTETEAQVRRLETGRSILDSVSKELLTFKRDLGDGDKARLDTYVEPDRRVEGHLLVDEQVGQLGNEGGAILIGLEVVLLFGPRIDLTGYTTDQLANARLALWAANVASEVLGDHDVGGELRP